MYKKLTLLSMTSFKKDFKMDTILCKKTNSRGGLSLIILLVLLFSAIPALYLWADVFTVTNTNDSGPGSLRQAIIDANTNPGTDDIHFNILGIGPHTIQPLLELPAISDPIIIDGYTQTGASPNTNPITMGSNAVLMIELDGSNAGLYSYGLKIDAGNSTVRGLVINRFSMSGIYLHSFGSNLIVGNFIGTNITGTVAMGNQTGVGIIGIPNNQIGGITAQERNIISSNTNGNITINAGINNGANENKVLGNFIGTNITGTKKLHGSVNGVSIGYSSNNVIGGTVTEARNIISGHNTGIIIYVNDEVSAATENQVLGNFIGTDLTGTYALSNVTGVVILSANYNQIGGTEIGSRNIISGNNSGGVTISRSAIGNQVQGNFIGTQVDGISPLGNYKYGVGMGSGGSMTSVEDNIIAFNGNYGIWIDSGTSNAILSNSIFSNNGLGIDITPQGVSSNDLGDSDDGANNLQNFPVLSSFVTYTYGTDISGILNSTPNASFTLEFFSNQECDPSGYGEGKNFLCREQITTDANGDVSFTVTAPIQVPLDHFITATATDPDGNTSEFSNCISGGVSDMEILPLSHNFGDMEIGTTSTLIITISNVGNADLEVFSASPQADWNSDFQITSAPNWPVMLPPTASTNVEITYTSSAEGPVESVLKISSNDPDESVVEVQLSGTGIVIPPEEKIENIIISFDESVDDGTLVGVGTGNSADNRLNALRNMLLEAQRLIDAGDYEAACDQLYSAYKKCDGEPNPPDFVEGESREELAEMITDLMQDLGCTRGLGKQIAPELENETAILPTEFSLEQNQPNPFNPTTTISYTVAKNSHVKLTIYNTLGQVVAVLVNGFQAQGSYNVMWNAEGQPSGFYIYCLETDGYTASKKMFLQK